MHTSLNVGAIFGMNFDSEQNEQRKERNLKLLATKLAVARMSYDSGNFSDSARHYHSALNIIQEYSLPGELTAAVLSGLAKATAAMGDFNQAEKLFRRALELDESDSSSLVEEAEDYHQLSLLYWRSRRQSLSRETAVKSWQLAQKDEHTPDELKAKLLKHFAVLEEQAGNLDECERYLNRAIDLIKSSSQLGKQSSIYGDVLLVQVLLFIKKGRLAEAVELYPLAMQTIEITRGVHHPRVQEVLAIFKNFENNNVEELSGETLRQAVLEAEEKGKHGII